MKDGELLCQFDLPMNWDVVSRMVNSIWESDGDAWSGMNSAAGGDLVIEMDTVQEIVDSEPRSIMRIVYREWEKT